MLRGISTFQPFWHVWLLPADLRPLPHPTLPPALSCLQTLAEFGRNYKIQAEPSVHLTSQAKLRFHFSLSR